MSATVPADKPAKPIKYRAACNRCHTSKVRCTGEKDGCSRCKYLRRDCVYSESLIGKSHVTRAKKRADAPPPSSHQSPCLTPALTPEWSQQQAEPMGLFDFAFGDLGDGSVHQSIEGLSHPRSNGSISSVASALNSGYSSAAGSISSAFTSPAMSPMPMVDDLEKFSLGGVDPIYSSPFSTGSSDMYPEPFLLTPPLGPTSGACTPQFPGLAATSMPTPAAVAATLEGGDPNFIAVCARVVEVLSHHLNTCTAQPGAPGISIDVVLHLSKNTITSLKNVTQQNLYASSASCPLLVIMAIRLMVTLFENALSAPIKNIALPTLSLGTYEIDWDESGQLRAQIIVKELWRCLAFLNKLNAKLNGFVPSAVVVDHQAAQGVEAGFCEAGCKEVIGRLEALIKHVEKQLVQ